MIRKAIAKITSKLTSWIVRLIACIVRTLLVSTLMAVTGIAELVLAMTPAMIMIAVIILASAA